MIIKNTNTESEVTLTNDNYFIYCLDNLFLYFWRNAVYFTCSSASLTASSIWFALSIHFMIFMSLVISPYTRSALYLGIVSLRSSSLSKSSTPLILLLNSSSSTMEHCLQKALLCHFLRDLVVPKSSIPSSRFAMSWIARDFLSLIWGYFWWNSRNT